MASEEVRIELEAAKALTQWKAQFAREVGALAKRLAAQSGQPNMITLSQYRQAARIALQSLSEAINDETASDGRPEEAA